jgi:hypothetical protein
MFYLAGTFLGKSLIMNVTINDCLSFSYPLKYNVEDIYINELIEKNSVQTSFNLKKPITHRFSNYKSVKGNFSFEYPSAFELNEEEFDGAEILYHIGFKDKSNPVQGFVQVWNLPHSLKEFLENSKAQASQNFNSFESKPVTVNNIPGFYWNYTVLTRNGELYKCSEVFLQKEERMYRISYFVPYKMWDKNQSDIYWSIVSSFKTF